MLTDNPFLRYTAIKAKYYKGLLTLCPYSYAIQGPYSSTKNTPHINSHKTILSVQRNENRRDVLVYRGT